LCTDPPAIETLTRSCLPKNSGFAERRRFFSSFAYGATITGKREGTGWRAVQGSVRTGSEYEDQNHLNVLSQKDGRYRFADLPSGDYELRIRAIGYNADPRTGVKLSETQAASFDWALQKGTVRWRDLSL